MDNCGTKKIVKWSNANKSYQLQYCKQKLSLATCAHKSYRSFDAILRFFIFLDFFNFVSDLILYFFFMFAHFIFFSDFKISFLTLYLLYFCFFSYYNSFFYNSSVCLLVCLLVYLSTISYILLSFCFSYRKVS